MFNEMKIYNKKHETPCEWSTPNEPKCANVIASTELSFMRQTPRVTASSLVPNWVFTTSVVQDVFGCEIGERLGASLRQLAIDQHYVVVEGEEHLKGSFRYYQHLERQNQISRDLDNYISKIFNKG